MGNCTDCRFGKFDYPGAAKGECRRFAPRSTIGQVDPAANYCNPEMASWPVVNNGDGCGEFEQREQVA